MPADQHRTQLLQELQQELLSWAKRRFCTVTVAAVVLGFLGGEQAVATNQIEVTELKAAALSQSNRVQINSKYWINIYGKKEPPNLVQILKVFTDAGFKGAFTYTAPLLESFPQLEASIKKISHNTLIYEPGDDGKAREVAELFRPFFRLTEIRTKGSDELDQLLWRVRQPGTEKTIAIFLVPTN